METNKKKKKKEKKGTQGILFSMSEVKGCLEVVHLLLSRREQGADLVVVPFVPEPLEILSGEVSNIFRLRFLQCYIYVSRVGCQYHVTHSSSLYSCIAYTESYLWCIARSGGTEKGLHL